MRSLLLSLTVFAVAGMLAAPAAQAKKKHKKHAEKTAVTRCFICVRPCAAQSDVKQEVKQAVTQTDVAQSEVKQTGVEQKAAPAAGQ